MTMPMFHAEKKSRAERTETESLSSKMRIADPIRLLEGEEDPSMYEAALEENEGTDRDGVAELEEEEQDEESEAEEDEEDDEEGEEDEDEDQEAYDEDDPNDFDEDAFE